VDLGVSLVVLFDPADVAALALVFGSSLELASELRGIFSRLPSEVAHAAIMPGLFSYFSSVSTAFFSGALLSFCSGLRRVITIWLNNLA